MVSSSGLIVKGGVVSEWISYGKGRAVREGSADSRAGTQFGAGQCGMAAEC